MTDNEGVIRQFLGAWTRCDPDELAAFFTDDAVWEDGVPSEPYRGKEAIRAQFARYTRHISNVQIEVLHEATAGDIVIHERVDRLTRKGRRLELKAVGVFELENQKIKANRDYWNPGGYASG